MIYSVQQFTGFGLGLYRLGSDLSELGLVLLHIERLGDALTGGKGARGLEGHRARAKSHGHDDALALGVERRLSSKHPAFMPSIEDWHYVHRVRRRLERHFDHALGGRPAQFGVGEVACDVARPTGSRIVTFATVETSPSQAVVLNWRACS